MTGSYGKTITSWLMRGMFENTGELVGMLGESKSARLHGCRIILGSCG